MQWNEKWIRPANPKIILVQPPESENYREIKSNFKLAPPTWAAILASETRRRSKHEIDFEIIYPPQADMSQSFLEKCATADILGITDWFSCHQSAMKIAKCAKKINPEILIVIGGINAGFLAKRILTNNLCVDLVISKDGEDVLWRIQEGHSFSSIPNLWYRKKTESLEFTHREKVNLNSIGQWDFNKSVDSVILQNYINAVNENPFATAPASVSLTRGCQKCQARGPCTYCTAFGQYRETAPEKAWEQLRHLRKNGIKYFFETGDDFSSLPYLKKLLTLRSREDDFRLRCYANPAYISAEVARIMKDLGFYEIFLGLETFDASISRRANRLTISPNSFERSIKFLGELDIKVCLPVLFGLPGETAHTAKKTATALINLIDKHTNVRLVLISLAIPLIGSPWFSQLYADPSVVSQYNTSGHNIFADDEFYYFKLLEISLKKEGTEINQIIDILLWLQSELKGKVQLGKFGAIHK